MDEYNPESPTGEDESSAIAALDGCLNSLSLAKGALQDGVVVMATMDDVAVDGDDFLASIPMPPVYVSSSDPSPESIEPGGHTPTAAVTSPEPEQLTLTKSSEPEELSPAKSISLSELQESTPTKCSTPEPDGLVPTKCNSLSSPSSTSSDGGDSAKRASRWDCSASTPKSSGKLPAASGVGAEMGDKASRSPTAPTIVMARGVRRGFSLSNNLGFRMSYRGFGLRFLNSSFNCVDEMTRVTGDCEDALKAVSTDVIPGSVHERVEPSAQSEGLPVESSQARGIGVFGPGTVPVQQMAAHVAPSSEKCASDNDASDVRAGERSSEEITDPRNTNCGRDLAKNFKSVPVTGSVSEDVGGGCGGASSAARSYEAEASVFPQGVTDLASEAVPPTSACSQWSAGTCLPEDNLQECDASNERDSKTKAQAAKTGRRKKNTSRMRFYEETMEGRRRSSRIRSMEERREREREERRKEEMSEGDDAKEDSGKDEPEVSSAPASPSEAPESAEVAPASPLREGPDDSVTEEIKTPVSSPMPDFLDRMDIDPHLIPLPPMPPPASMSSNFAIPSSFGAQPPPPPSSANFPHSRNSSSPGSGSEDGSGRPEKVKSRWRRNSELERVVPAIVPPPPPPRALPLPPPPHIPPYGVPQSASAVICDEHVSLGSCVEPSPLSTSGVAMGGTVSSSSVLANGQSIPPILGPPPPPPPVRGFIDPDEVTEDWSEKEVTSSLTKNPLPLRPRVVNHVVNTADAERVADPPSSSSKGSLTKSVANCPPKDKPPYMNYDPILENSYLSERRRSKSKREVRRMVCDCSITKEELEQGFVACGDDCLNRLLMMECGSRCPTGEHCTNRRFQKREYAKVEAIKTEKKGWGLKTQEDLPVGSFVLEYVGEILDQREFKRRVKEYAHDRHRHYYFMALRTDEIIDATQKGNLSRFINHSCDPNCETQKWTVNGDLKVGFFARRTIPVGEELTFDYQFQRYGKEAQKCHCEASNCRGYIGGDKQTPLKKDRRDVKKKKAAEERRREDMEDIDLEDEIDKFSQLDGLKNRVQTLSLCRLMVRAEETEFRLVLLQCLQKTAEHACLRLFLDYHGLSLMWSWMVDIGNGVETLPLKSEILKTLGKLPISNKNMVMDSKVLAIVQRWSEQIKESRNAKQSEVGDSVADATQTLVKDDGLLATEDSSSDAESLLQSTSSVNIAKDEHGVAESDLVPADSAALMVEHTISYLLDSVMKSGDGHSVSDTSDAKAFCKDSPKVSEEETSSSDCGPTKPDEALEIVPQDKCEDDSAHETEEDVCSAVTDVKVEADVHPAFDENSVASVTDMTPDQRNAEIKVEARDTSVEEGEFSCLASELLQAWDGLKEVYRIPKREQNQNRREHEREADLHESDEREHGHEWDRRERGRGRDRDKDERDERKDKEYDHDGRHDHHSHDRKDRHEERHRGGSEYDRSRSSRPGRGPPTEREPRRKRKRRGSNFDGEPDRKRHGQMRMRFNKAQRRKEFEMKVQQEEENAIRRLQEEEYYRHQQQQPPEAHMVPMDQVYYDPNYCPIPNPAGPVPYYDPTNGYGMPPMPLGPPDPMVLTGPIPNRDTMGEMPPTSSPAQNAASCPNQIVYPMFPQTPVPPNYIGPPPPGPGPHYASGPAAPQAPPHVPQFPHQGPPQFPHQGPPPPVNHQIPPPLPLQAPPPLPHQLPPHAQPPVYYPPPQGMVVHLPEPGPWPHVVSAPVVEEAPPPPEHRRPAKPPKLPHGWKSAKDNEGNVYYYHNVTRQTQWEAPVCEDTEMDLGTPTVDEPKKKKATTTAAADTSSELARRIKEHFRSKMSQYIVQCLNPYRKPDCKLGRISSTEEFKHLARKLTHFVMAKELKYCRNVEDLECNENVKHKAKDFVRKYMAKFGPVYKKAASPKEDEDD